ncbi:MAG: hypothetical protein WBC40_07245 [Halobacteriota archaeon]
MSDVGRLGYEGILDTTVARDETLLRENSEKIGRFNDSVVKGIINPRLKESESLAFLLKEAAEISGIVMGLNRVYDTFKYFPEPLGILPSIESKVREITDEAKQFLITDNLLCDIIGEILDKIHILLNLEYEIKLYVSRDMEIEDWKEFVFSIGIKEEDFSKIIKLWDEIEEEAENVIEEMKKKSWTMSHIETIDKMLSIEVRSLENV